jgi:hypothetical protein
VAAEEWRRKTKRAGNLAEFFAACRCGDRGGPSVSGTDRES